MGHHQSQCRRGRERGRRQAADTRRRARFRAATAKVAVVCTRKSYCLPPLYPPRSPNASQTLPKPHPPANSRHLRPGPRRDHSKSAPKTVNVSQNRQDGVEKEEKRRAESSAAMGTFLGRACTRPALPLYESQNSPFTHQERVRSRR